MTGSARAHSQVQKKAQDGTPEHRGHGGVRPGIGPVAPALQLKPTTVGAAGDAFEQEADRAAEKVIQGKTADPLSPVGPKALQRLTQAPALSADEIAAQGGVAQRLFDEESPTTAAEKLVQTKSVDGAGPSTIDLPSPGPGFPLAPDTRGRLESGLGADLSDVRVHDDSSAHAAADAMGAKAFTQGSDISLGSGQSPDDLSLMAHEAAHVVQQAGGSGTVVQRKDDASTPESDAPLKRQHRWPKDGSAIDSGKKLITVPVISLPSFKAARTKLDLKDNIPNRHPEGIPLRDARGRTSQNSKWPKAAKVGDGHANKFQEEAGQSGPLKDAVSKKLQEKDIAATKEIEGAGGAGGGRFYLMFRNPGAGPRAADGRGESGVDASGIVIGRENDILNVAALPRWDSAGEPTVFQIDHVVEMQLGGIDDPSNYWLLEEDANRAAGHAIEAQIALRVNAVLDAARREKIADVPADKRAAGAGGWKFKYIDVDDKLPFSKDWRRNWMLDGDNGVGGIRQGAPLKHLRAMKFGEMKYYQGGEKKLVLFLGPTAEHRSEVPWDKENIDSGEKAFKPEDGWWFYRNKPGEHHNNIHITRIKFQNGKGGSLQGKLFKNESRGRRKVGIESRGTDENSQIPIESSNGRMDNTGFVVKKSFLEGLADKFQFKPFSPIHLDAMDLVPDQGLIARGRLFPTIPLITDAEVDVVVDGDGVFLSKVFSADDFPKKSSLKFGDSSLELRLGVDAFNIDGEVNFAVENLGAGRLYAGAGLNRDEVNFALGGEFDFLSDLFEPAQVKVWYQDHKFGGQGRLGVKEGKVKGLKSAIVNAEFDDKGFKADGSFETTIPGVESGKLNFDYKETGQLEIGGNLKLGSKVPGISSGSIDAQLVRNQEGGWKVFGKITAVPAIPGVASEITGVYDDGAIQLEATAKYTREMAEGELTIGVSNRPIAATGKPEGEPGNKLSAYGGGTVALTLAPWLKARAGLHLLPNGEIEVAGKVGLPSALELFPRKSLDKELLKVRLDIPILGISVAGQNVGIFATIAGRLQLIAYVGPMALTDLDLAVAWNPDHQDKTTVSGHAALNLPAGAGVRLGILAGIGAGIPVVSARLGLEIGGYLGVEAALTPSVDIQWTPTKGLALHAEAKATAEPVFKFDITGNFSVDADLVVTSKNLYEKKWDLKQFEYGSGLKLGMTLPVDYEEGKPFDFSLDDVTFEVPDIDPKTMLSGLVESIT